ncbi:MAG: ABC transporter ATP-binding protein [Pseudomonadota bacterium]
MVLTVKHVAKAYGKGGQASAAEPVLRDVSMDVRAGESVALTGESGSGKSTLLHLIGGLDRPDAGEIWLDGARLDTCDDAQRAAIRQSDIGIVFQQFNLVPSLTVHDNIRLQARLAQREDSAQIEALVSTLGLQSQLKKYPEALSGGQQQRVAIARALAVRPKIVLADEPTGNLDEATSDTVLSELLALVAETQCALLMVTHSQVLAQRLSQHMHLSQGQLAPYEAQAPNT